LLLISPTTADTVSAAATTFVTSASVHAAVPAAATVLAVATIAVATTGGDAGGFTGVVHAIAQLVPSVAVAHPIRHCPHGGLLLISPTTADIFAAESAAAPTLITSATVHAAAAGP